MSNINESSSIDAPNKRFQTYQSFQPVDDDKVNPFPIQSNTSLLSNSLSSIYDKQWTTERIRNWISNIITLISVGFLIPGLWFPMMTLRISALEGSIEVAHETRSIWSTIQYLFEHGGYLAGTLIFIFSVVIPFAKAILLLTINVSNNIRYNSMVYNIIRDWGKWSMADVFVTAIFISYLSSTVIVDIKAQLLSGFYLFLVYCIASLLATQIMCPPLIVNTKDDQEKMKTTTIDQNTSLPNRVRDDNIQLGLLDSNTNNLVDGTR